MKYWHYIVLLLATALFFAGCGSSDVPSGSAGTDVPYPEFNAIIPLEVSSSKSFRHTLYNAAGDSIISQDPLSYDIHECLILNGTTLTLFEAYDTLQENDTIVFSYQWRSSNKGLFIGHINMDATTTGGLFVYGEYSDTGYTIYNEPILWLKYPASSGDSWEYATDTDTSTYEVVQHNAPFAISPTESVPAYLYKKTSGSIESYYYYHPDVGLLACIEYVDGIRRRTLSVD